MFSDEDRQRNLRSFQKKARLLLTESERDYLHDVLKQYQTYKDVHRLMTCLKSALDTPTKLDLLREIRGLVPPGHLRQFDDTAPYKKMAHPYQPPPPVGDNVWRRMPSWHGRSSQPTSNHSDWIQSPNGMLSPVDDSRIITVDTEGEDIGFIIKGGAEQKMGIFVARVEPDSDAEMSGLQAGDQLLEVNNISFEVIPIHTASTVLRSSNRLKMKVVTPPKKTSHKDRKDGKWFESRGNVNASINKERTVLIQLDEHHQFIGFNIRGGSEYGLGVFVSRTDPGGLAELNGIKPGDQILEVNGKKFDNITHAEAVEIIRNQRNMIMRVRSTNKVPTYPRIEDNLPPPPRSQSAVPLKGGSSPPSSYDGSVKSAPLPNKDWLVRNEPVNKGFSDEIKRPASAASSHSSKHSSKQIAPTGPSSGGVKEGHQDPQGGKEAIRKEPEPPPRTSTPTKRGPPRVREKKGRKLGRSFSMKVTGEKQRPMLDRDDVYHKREKKGKTLREMFFGTKSGHKNKTSMEAVEEEHDINKSRDDTKTDEELNESMGERKGRKGRGKMHGLLNSFRKTREDVKVKRRVPLQREDSSDLDVSNLEASGQWATRKGTPGTPDKAEDIVPYGSIGKQRGLFVQGAGTQVMLASITAPSHHAMLEESAKKVLNPDESKAVLRHIRRYDEEGNIDALVVPLLAILDQPEKVLLLRDIRGFIAPKDIGRFDSLVSKKELEAMKQVRKQEKENSSSTNVHPSLHKTQSTEGYNGPQRSQYSHMPTISAPLVAPEPIPVGPSEYVNIKTSEDSNLTRLRGKKVMISSNPEIIPRQDSYADASSPELSPGQKSNRNFTFGESEAAVLASLNSALGPGDPSRDLNANSVVNHNTPHSASLEERDFRGGFTSIPVSQQSPLQTFTPRSNYPPEADEISGDSDSSSAAMRLGSYGFQSETRNDMDRPISQRTSSPSQRPPMPPPPPPFAPPPPPLYANSLDFPPPPPPESFAFSNGYGHTVNPPDEPLYAKVNKSKKGGNHDSRFNSGMAVEAPYASISEFDKLSINSAESERSSLSSPKKGILKNSFNNDMKRPNIQVRNRDLGDDYEPSPLREIGNEARMEGTLEVDVPWPSSPPPTDSYRVDLHKINPSLGLSVSGGSDCKHQPSVKIDQIIPGGAAAEDGTLQVSYTLVGIDGTSLRYVTHDEAVDIIRHSYADKSTQFMSVEFLPTT